MKKAALVMMEKTVDELFDVRQELKVLKRRDEQLSEALKTSMKQNGLSIIETNEHCAVLEPRSGGAIDPRAFFEALGKSIRKFFACVTLRKESKGEKTGADYYLSKEAIDNITEPTEIIALRITKLADAPAKKPAPNQKVKFA